MRVLQLFLSLILLTTACFGQYLKPIRGMQFVNRTHRQARGLGGLWLFNEGSGNKVFDLSGNNHPGTFVNSPTWVSGKYGSAVDFVAGSSQYIDVLNLPAGFITPPCTVVIWFKCDVLPSTFLDEYTLFRYAQPGHDTLRYQIRIDDDDSHISADCFEGGFDSSQAIIAGRWHQVVIISRSTTDHQIYLDTIAGGTTANAFGDVGTTPELRFGVNYYTDLRDYMLGQIDSVLIYNRALTAGERAELYAKPFGMLQKDNTALIASTEAPPPPTGGQVIMITSAIPVILILAICLTIGRIKHNPTRGE